MYKSLAVHIQQSTMQPILLTKIHGKMNNYRISLPLYEIDSLDET